MHECNFSPARLFVRLHQHTHTDTHTHTHTWLYKCPSLSSLQHLGAAQASRGHKGRVCVLLQGPGCRAPLQMFRWSADDWQHVASSSGIVLRVCYWSLYLPAAARCWTNTYWRLYSERPSMHPPTLYWSTASVGSPACQLSTQSCTWQRVEPLAGPWEAAILRLKVSEGNELSGKMLFTSATKYSREGSTKSVCESVFYKSRIKPPHTFFWISEFPLSSNPTESRASHVRFDPGHAPLCFLIWDMMFSTTRWRQKAEFGFIISLKVQMLWY